MDRFYNNGWKDNNGEYGKQATVYLLITYLPV